MKAVRIPAWFVAISIIVFVVLISTACIPVTVESSTANDALDDTISSLGTEAAQLATLAAVQEQIDDYQQEAISHLSTLMPSGLELVTTTPTSLPLPEEPTSFPVCTPPACAPDEMYYCPDECPGGCGTTCATATPGVSLGTGSVWGKICYPGEIIPEMTIYFQEINTQQILDFSIEVKQDLYHLEIPAGVYVAFTWLTNKDAGGGYTQFIRCKLTILSCMDHSLVPFLVQENHATVDVDICDWDADTTLFPTVLEE